jgi:hypothetical protein
MPETFTGHPGRIEPSSSDKCEDDVLLSPSTVGRRHRRDVNGPVVWINNRSAGDAERVEISAGELRSRHRIPQRLCPNLRPSSGIQS